MSLLPTTKTKPKPQLSDYAILIYGPPKIGKTTFVSRFNNVVIAATEEGYGALEVFAAPIKTWQAFLDFCNELAAGKHSFENVCIDTVDNLYDLCVVHVLGKNNVEHESELGFGKGWALVMNEFKRALTKLSHLPYGLIFISHQASEEIDGRNEKYKKSIPSLPNKPRKTIMAMCDFILYFISRVNPTDNSLSRIILTKPGKHHEAGDRTGFLPEEIPLNHTIFVQEFTAAIAKTTAKTKKGNTKAGTKAGSKKSTDKAGASDKSESKAESKKEKPSSEPTETSNEKNGKAVSENPETKVPDTAETNSNNDSKATG